MASLAAGAAAVADVGYLDLSLSDYLDQVAAATAAPGAGAAAATTVALAAGLAAMAAGLSRRQLAEADEAARRMQELQERVKPLAEADAAAYGDVLSAQASPGIQRAAAVHEALVRAADVPLEVATIGAAVLDTAADVARNGNPRLRGDALTACLLAQAAVLAATALVELNLPDGGDPRRVRAAELADAARSASLPPVTPSNVVAT